MALVDGLLRELEQEAQTTRRVLERVPDDRLTWRPHPKARTLGELALHVAVVPGAVAQLVASPSPAQAPRFTDPSPASAAELIPALEQSIGKAREVLGAMDDAELLATWRMMRGERELFALPRAAVLRSVMLNHWYHHRGQLTVYLRVLGLPVPSIYGPSADENPFAQQLGGTVPTTFELRVIGLHRVTILEISEATRLRVSGLEAFDGTPILDLKPVLDRARER